MNASGNEIAHFQVYDEDERARVKVASPYMSLEQKFEKQKDTKFIICLARFLRNNVPENSSATRSLYISK